MLTSQPLRQVREALAISAMLRLPRTTSRAAIKARVGALIQELVSRPHMACTMQHLVVAGAPSCVDGLFCRGVDFWDM